MKPSRAVLFYPYGHKAYYRKTYISCYFANSAIFTGQPPCVLEYSAANAQ